MIAPLSGPQDSDDKVGYRRPPRGSQFKPGVSGNPKGRPKKRKNLSVQIEEALERTVTIEEGGRKKKITVNEVILRRLTAMAAKGDTKAIAMLFRLKASQCDLSTEPLTDWDSTADKDLLDDYVLRRSGGEAPSAARSAKNAELDKSAPAASRPSPSKTESDE